MHMTKGMFRKDFIFKKGHNYKNTILSFMTAPDFRKRFVMFYMDSKMSCN